MDRTKELKIRIIERKARNEMATLAGQLARTRSDMKEPILAAMEFERWLAETCQECRRMP